MRILLNDQIMEKIKHIPPFKVIGLALEGKTTNENGQSSVDCAQLWQRFVGEGIAEYIPGKLSGDSYAIYYGYEGDHTAPFSYFIGCPVLDESPCPAGLSELQIPGGDFVSYTAKGKIPDCMSEAWQQIWLSDIPRSYAYDFEVYGAKSRNWEDAEVEIYLGLEGGL